MDELEKMALEEDVRFNGTFYHNLDPKNRIFIPAKLLTDIGNKLVIVKSFREKCLNVFSVPEWNAYVAPIKLQPRATQERVFRFFYSTMIVATPDSQGRVTLTQELLDYAGIDKSLAIVGWGGGVEIWSADTYAGKKAEEDPDAIRRDMESCGL